MVRSTEPDAPKKAPATITIREEWCKGCEFCVTYCPRDVLAMNGVLAVAVKPEQCTRCQICVWVCPDFAIKVI
jgi:NAD-dependent dihydropyrimidine dehydrogenase PreA subunit